MALNACAHSSLKHVTKSVGQLRFFSTLTSVRTIGMQKTLSAPGILRTQSCKRDSSMIIRARRLDEAGNSPPESVDVSVFRFTLGIPGFDDSDLPRILGILFGGLLILNHFFSLSTLTPAQLRTEGVGLVLAVVSISLPFIGRQLNGARTKRQVLEPGRKQIFSLADGLTESQRKDLAWASYTLLRNTSTIAMLVVHSGQVVSARGFWDTPKDTGPGDTRLLGWLKQKLDKNLEDFSNLKEPFYLSGNTDVQILEETCPRETASMLVQPFPRDSNEEGNSTAHGFLLLISNTPWAYSRKDMDWAASLAKKLSDVLCQ